MAVPRLAEAKPFVRVEGDPAIRRALGEGTPSRAEELGHVDLVVCGTVAVNRAGVRVGKGGGYSDLALALLAAVWDRQRARAAPQPPPPQPRRRRRHASGRHRAGFQPPQSDVPLMPSMLRFDEARAAVAFLWEQAPELRDALLGEPARLASLPDAALRRWDGCRGRPETCRCRRSA